MRRRAVLPEAITRRSAAVATALAFSAGLAAGTLLSSGRPESPTVAVPLRRADATPAAEAGPARVTNGVPSGFARTEEGAVAAAASFVCTGQALLDLDPLAAQEAVRSMAASASADQQVADTDTQLRQVSDELAAGQGPIVFRQAAVAYRVEAFDSERARVAVWNVGVLTRDGVAPPQAGWAISTFDLVWERSDWRIWGETVAPGPAPVLNDSTAPATSDQLVDSLNGFIDFGAQS